MEVVTRADAKKQRFGREEALELARAAAEVFVAKGKNVVHVDMKKPPSDDELAKLLLGPSGFLRAPALRRGKTLLIGFDAATYAQVLEGRASKP